ncbi:MAG: polysaccharide biosynthesis C-terminal domain-containing protein [Flavobacteriales bacterium]
MQRTFITNLALVLVLNLLVKPFYILGIDAGVQEAVGATVYGSYAALLSLGFLLNIVLDLGITNYNTRHIAQHTHLMGKYFSGVVGVRVVLAGLYAVLSIGTGLLLGYSGAQLGMLGWLVFNQVLVATILYLRSNIAGAQRYRTDSLLSVLDRVLLIGMVGWALWGRASGTPFRIEWFVWAQTIAYGVTALVALVIVLRLSGRVRVGWNPAFGRVVLRQSFPYALLVLLMTFYYRTDTLMLERMLPDGAFQAGVYYQGFRFFEAFNMLGFLFAGLLLPMFSRLLAPNTGDRAGLDPLVSLSFRLVLAGSIAVAVFGAARSQAVMDLLYSSHTERSAPVFALLIWSFVAVSTTYIFGTLLTAKGDLRTLNLLAAGGAVVNIGLNLVLIPMWKAEGAAWASLVTQVATALAQLVLATRVLGLKTPYGILLRGAGYGLATMIVVWVMDWIALVPVLELVVYGVCATGLAMVTGMVDLRGLRNTLGEAPEG